MTGVVRAEKTNAVAAILKRYWGFPSLRPMQDQAIAAALAHRDSLLVMPTGGGKSLCYQVPPLVDDCLDIVISPLISLMKDQVDSLREAGVPAAALYSGMSADERHRISASLECGELRILLVSPERMLTDGFLRQVEQLKVSRFAIDEAHCISQWGHDFRPEYRQLASLRDRFPNASLHAFTATATPRVRDDIVRQLNLRDPAVLVGAVDRENLVYRVVPKSNAESQVLDVLQRRKGEAVIIYCISRKETESLAEWLRKAEIDAKAYHAGMEPHERHRVQEAFANEELDVVVATVAFGMGIDRSNVRCVIHTGMPKSLEHYQQETGRAGRDGLEAECVLLYNAGDAIKWERIIAQSCAEAESSDTVYQASMTLLRHMQSFANSPVCRHRALSEYFGQTYAKANCTACDVCLDEVECVADSTTIAQKILSCVARAQQRFGVGHIVDILVGAKTENIRKFGHEDLTTYGILEEMDKKAVQAFVYQLLDQKALGRTEGEFPVLRLNAASLEILRGQRQVKLIAPAKKVAKRTERGEKDYTGADAGLMDHLRAWRRELAMRHHVPPFTIFHDTTLIALARLRPTTVSALQGVPGIGEKRAAAFGQELCSQIAAYCREHGASSAQAAPEPHRPRPSRPQTAAQAFDLFRGGVSLDDVAQRLDRAISTTSQYLCDFIQETNPESIDAWVSPAIQQRVRAAIGPTTDNRTAPLFEKLGGEIPHGKIRVVMTWLLTRGEIELVRPAD